MPAKQGPGEQPRTDLPPTKLPYDDDYFGTNEEDGIVREREASGEDEDESPSAA